MSLGLVGRKIGMTRVFTDDGDSIRQRILTDHRIVRNVYGSAAAVAEENTIARRYESILSRTGNDGVGVDPRRLAVIPQQNSIQVDAGYRIARDSRFRVVSGHGNPVSSLRNYAVTVRGKYLACQAWAKEQR